MQADLTLLARQRMDAAVQIGAHASPVRGRICSDVRITSAVWKASMNPTHAATQFVLTIAATLLPAWTMVATAQTSTVGPSPQAMSVIAEPIAFPLRQESSQRGEVAEEVEDLGEEAAGEGNESEGEGEIETDRDSFTPATSTVAGGRVVFESAYSFIDNRAVPETHSFPELLIRYGLTDAVELRLGWNEEIGGAGSPISGNVPNAFDDEAGIEDESRLLYGAKFFLTRQCNGRPESSWIVQGFTPTTGESNDTLFATSYVVGWELPNESVWDSALRYSTGVNEDDRFNVWSPSTVLKIPIGERWKVHAEYFGVFTDGRESESTQHFLSPGAHYLVTENVEIGMRVGWGLNDQSPNFFANAGFGWQF
jgi:hypothetical protein